MSYPGAWWLRALASVTPGRRPDPVWALMCAVAWLHERLTHTSGNTFTQPKEHR